VLNATLKEEILTHLNREYPREGCGVIVLENKKHKWYAVTNIAKSDDDFIFDPIEYMRINLKSKPLAIVHSHPDTTSEPSKADRQNCNFLNLDFYIFSLPDKNLTILKPNE
jgi:proteasome lid subunit RPN8/RPN11